MKHLSNIYECIIIVCVAIIIVLPEIAYSCLLRVRDRLEDIAGEIINE